MRVCEIMRAAAALCVYVCMYVCVLNHEGCGRTLQVYSCIYVDMWLCMHLSEYVYMYYLITVHSLRHSMYIYIYIYTQIYGRRSKQPTCAHIYVHTYSILGLILIVGLGWRTLVLKCNKNNYDWQSTNVHIHTLYIHRWHTLFWSVIKKIISLSLSVLKSSKMAHFVVKCNKEDHLSISLCTQVIKDGTLCFEV